MAYPNYPYPVTGFSGAEDTRATQGNKYRLVDKAGEPVPAFATSTLEQPSGYDRGNFPVPPNTRPGGLYAPPTPQVTENRVAAAQGVALPYPPAGYVQPKSADTSYRLPIPTYSPGQADQDLANSRPSAASSVTVDSNGISRRGNSFSNLGTEGLDSIDKARGPSSALPSVPAFLAGVKNTPDFYSAASDAAAGVGTGGRAQSSNGLLFTGAGGVAPNGGGYVAPNDGGIGALISRVGGRLAQVEHGTSFTDRLLTRNLSNRLDKLYALQTTQGHLGVEQQQLGVQQGQLGVAQARVGLDQQHIGIYQAQQRLAERQANPKILFDSYKAGVATNPNDPEHRNLQALSLAEQGHPNLTTVSTPAGTNIVPTPEVFRRGGVSAPGIPTGQGAPILGIPQFDQPFPRP